jgi:condensin-2 complex subunit H2
MSQAEDSSKWAALLQPIKELEKNWDIDIAGDLTDYLEELSGLTFTVDGLSNLNFAEAAIVVYGSSCTYGKKVEYLLKLTIAALENSRAKQKENQASRNRKVRAFPWLLAGS